MTTTFSLPPHLDALVRERRSELVELRVPGSPDSFSLVVPRDARLVHRADAPSNVHGTTVTVATVRHEDLHVGVDRTALAQDIDAATWLELTLAATEGAPVPVTRATWGALPAGEAVIARDGARLERVRTIQCGPSMWTVRASGPAGAASDPIAELAATSLVPHRSTGLAEPLEGVEVRGLDVAVRWPRSWFLTTDVDVPGGLAGFLERVVDGRTVGLMRIMVGAEEERGAMEDDARAWVASGVTDDAHGEGVVRSRGVGAAALVLALVGPSRRAHVPLWATNRRSLDLIVERATPTGAAGP